MAATAVLLLAAARAGEPALPDPYPSVAAAYLLTLDDKPLWSHHPQARRAAASLAKLLTAMTLAQTGWDPQAAIDVSVQAARTTRPTIGLQAGDSVRAEDALRAMLVQSANDACRALVEHASADSAAFAARMNARAQQLGMLNSHFVDPCGFDAPGQYSTASDLLRLARAAYADERIRQMVGLPGGSLRTDAGRTLTYTSTNQLLGRLDGVVGMKTGNTDKAGYCLIAVVERAGHRAWLVLLDSRQRWWTAHRMITDAFATAEPR